MSEDSPAEPEADEEEAGGSEAGAAAEAAVEEAGAAAEAAVEEAGAPEPPAEWVPSVELHLPPEVAEALHTVMNALLAFGQTVKPVLDESYRRTAEEAAETEPLYLPEGLAQITSIIDDWSSQLDQLLAPFKTYIARIERENQPISEYRAALLAVFAPPPPEEDEETEGGPSEEGEAEE